MDNKANNMRELSLDEMDMVFGGADFKYDGKYVYYRGAKETPAQFTDYIYKLAENFGVDVAIKLLEQLTGYTSAEMGNGMGATKTGKEAVVYMAPIMNNFWANCRYGS